MVYNTLSTVPLSPTLAFGHLIVLPSLSKLSLSGPIFFKKSETTDVPEALAPFSCIRRLLPPGACSSPDTVTPSAVTSTDTFSAAVSKRARSPGTRYTFWIFSTAWPLPNGTVTCVSQSSSDGLLALYRSASWTVFCSVAVLSGCRPSLPTSTLFWTLVSLDISTTA